MLRLGTVILVKAFCSSMKKSMAFWLLGVGAVFFTGADMGRGECLSQNLYGYPDLDKVRSFLEKRAQGDPRRVRLSSLGYSYLGHQIFVVKIGSDENRHRIMINGAHHGDEKITVLVALGFMDFILQHSDDPELNNILNDYNFYLVPIVNPDGYCNHSRNNAQGYDINRDYYHFDELANARGFKTPEARLVTRLMEKNKFKGAIALHSGDEAVYWPMGDSPHPSAHHQIFGEIARLTANKMGFDRRMQSYYDYPTQGEFIDFVYKTHHILGLTIELSQDHLPRPGIHREIVKKGIDGILAYLSALKDVTNKDVTNP
jgi:hypothetical protein